MCLFFLSVSFQFSPCCAEFMRWMEHCQQRIDAGMQQNSSESKQIIAEILGWRVVSLLSPLSFSFCLCLFCHRVSFSSVFSLALLFSVSFSFVSCLRLLCLFLSCVGFLLLLCSLCLLVSLVLPVYGLLSLSFSSYLHGFPAPHWLHAFCCCCCCCRF